MAKNEKIIAIWAECDIEIADVAADESMPTTGFENIGTIKVKTTTLEATDGEKLELRRTGNKIVDSVETDGGFDLKTTVIEPAKLYKALGLSDEDMTSGRQKVKTHVVEKRKAVRLTPKRVGATGIEAPVTSVSFKPAGSEEEGNSAEVTFAILQGMQDYWYERVKKTAATTVGE